LSIIADFGAGRYLPWRRKDGVGATILNDTVGFPAQIVVFMPTPHKNKTLATFLALALGGIGVHRFYLRGSVDRLGLLHVCSIPITGLVYAGARGANPFYVLLPLLVSYIVAFIEALVIGLTPDEKWDAAYNANSGRASRSNWLLAVLLVATMLAGSTVLIATISRLFDLLYTGGAYG
jgi:TM2 domain